MTYDLVVEIPRTTENSLRFPETINFATTRISFYFIILNGSMLPQTHMEITGYGYAVNISLSQLVCKLSVL